MYVQQSKEIMTKRVPHGYVIIVMVICPVLDS